MILAVAMLALAAPEPTVGVRVVQRVDVSVERTRAITLDFERALERRDRVVVVDEEMGPCDAACASVVRSSLATEHLVLLSFVGGVTSVQIEARTTDGSVLGKIVAVPEGEAIRSKIEALADACARHFTPVPSAPTSPSTQLVEPPPTTSAAPLVLTLAGFAAIVAGTVVGTLALADDRDVEGALYPDRTLAVRSSNRDTKVILAVGLLVSGAALSGSGVLWSVARD
ncbi:MAG: hypothetical protein RIT81_17650 [Deltaproteobacteria bacterium]